MRSYERPLAALTAMLTVLLLLAIFQPRILLLDVPEQRAATSQDTPSGATPVADQEEPQKAPRQHNDSGTRIGPPPDSQGPPYHKPDTLADRPSYQLLCSDPERLSILTGSGLAVAADPDGHYTLYALPDSQTGMPSKDSYELLRGCLPKKIFANETALKTTSAAGETNSGGKNPASGPSGTKAGASNVKHPTRRIASDNGPQLVTAYEVATGLRLTQRLGIQPGKLRIIYEVANTSDKPNTVELRSLLSPTPASPSQDVLFELPNGGQKDRIERDTVIGNDLASTITNIQAPRPAAASDSTAFWKAAAGPQPSKIIFADFHRLNSGPFDYDAAGRYPLPPNASIAVYWKGLSLEPGESVTVEQTYGPKTNRGSTP